VLGPLPEYTTCSACGTSISEAALDRHSCDPLHRAAHAGRIAEEELERFDEQLERYLATSQGRFAVYYAERERRGAP